MDDELSTREQVQKELPRGFKITAWRAPDDWECEFQGRRMIVWRDEDRRLVLEEGRIALPFRFLVEVIEYLWDWEPTTPGHPKPGSRVGDDLVEAAREMAAKIAEDKPSFGKLLMSAPIDEDDIPDRHR